jgi:MFS family permease
MSTSEEPATADVGVRQCANTDEQVPASPKDATVSVALENACEPEREASGVLLFIFCAIGAMEGADVALLPSVLLALQKDLGMALTDLGYAMVAQAVLQNIAAPIWGILADRGILRRKTILIVGSVLQGLVTAILAIVTDFGPMIFLRGLNGAMLAALRPISNGMIADVTSEERQGKVYSRVQSAIGVGMLITFQVAIPISTERVLGIQGWRVAFVVLGFLSFGVAGLVALLLEEPPLLKDDASEERGGLWAIVGEARALLRFFRMPTFCVMIMQGIFGTIPWTVMGMLTLFYQLSGRSNFEAAALAIIGSVSGIIGNLIGGFVCDRLARRFGKHGRPLGAQISVTCGIPIMFLILWGIPPGSGSFWVYVLLSIAFGLLASWCQAGVNLPILADIVPAHSRSRVMAWECALENSLANLLGPPIVTLLSVHVFGYTFGEGDTVDPPDLPSAVALGKALTATICGPGIVCLCAYSMLHWSYPRDTRTQNAHSLSEAAREPGLPTLMAQVTPTLKAEQDPTQASDDQYETTL